MIALELLAAHLVGDFVLQPHRMAVLKLTDPLVRAAHVHLYSIPFVVVAAVHASSALAAVGFVVANAAVHYVVDGRRWASGAEWPPQPIVVDQTLHLLTLAILGRMLV